MTLLVTGFIAFYSLIVSLSPQRRKAQGCGGKDSEDGGHGHLMDVFQHKF